MEYADIVLPEEMKMRNEFVSEMIQSLKGDGNGKEGFSFKYNGESSTDIISTWEYSEQGKEDSNGLTLHSFVIADAETGLEITVRLKEYTDFPVLEWTLFLTNTGKADSGLITDIRSLDAVLPFGGSGNVLHHFEGDYYSRYGFQPYRKELHPGTELEFACAGGRPTDKEFPYYNIESMAQGTGVIAVIGWAGQWSSSFSAKENELHITGGQEKTCFRLKPGESVRTPISVLMFYTGDQIRSQNLWRRWMMACNMPRPGGKLPEPMLPAGTNGLMGEMIGANEENQIQYIDRYIEEGTPITHWWMDAGWYICLDSPEGGKWPKTGTWKVDTGRFPKGLRAITDHAHEKGLKTVVWFEPERVAPDTELYTEHADWLLGWNGQKHVSDMKSGDELWSGQKLLNLGDPEACEWLTERITSVIRDQGIDLYRQDFNFAPLAYWRDSDEPEREGMHEIRHVEGYLRYWDALREEFPDMLLDTCASGGRRMDLETLRRSVPLHKTDYNYWDLPVKQAFHHTLFSWIPFFGAPVVPFDNIDPYVFRSAMCLSTNLGFDYRNRELDFSELSRLTEDWKKVAHLYYGDYYPLTPYSRSESVWMAWQFHRPDLEEGMIQVFRRPESPYESACFRLRGLDPDAVYSIENLDDPEYNKQISGGELMEKGLKVVMPEVPEAGLLIYKKY